jgi:hypothetical protein
MATAANVIQSFETYEWKLSSTACCLVTDIGPRGQIYRTT